MPALGEPDAQLNLGELVSHPRVVEVLGALSLGPMTLAEIRAKVPARRRGLAAALRLVAAGGLVTRNGSWDTDAPLGAVYRHTDLGRLVVETLSRSSVWTSMYDRSGTENAHSWKR